MEPNRRNQGHSSRAEDEDCFIFGRKTARSKGATRDIRAKDQRRTGNTVQKTKEVREGFLPNPLRFRKKTKPTSSVTAVASTSSDKRFSTDVGEPSQDRTKTVHRYTVQKPKKVFEGFVPNPTCNRKKTYTSSVTAVASTSSDKRFSTDGKTPKSPVVDAVSPYDGYMNELHEGSQELVYISHFSDPENFFVQRDSDQDLIKEMLEEFQNAPRLYIPSVKDICAGNIYLLLSKADKTWQRVRVVYAAFGDVENPMYRVRYIDTGTTENVYVTQLRICPVERLRHPPPLALHCSLANVGPRFDSWGSDEYYMIRDIVDKKCLVMHVRNVWTDGGSSDLVMIECDVTTLEHGTNLAHALAFLGRAKLKDPTLPYPKTTGLPNKPKIFVNYSDLKPKEIEDVLITHIVRPCQFYVMKVSLEGAYRQLCEELNGEYSTSSDFVYCPVIGQAYVVNTEKYLKPMFGERWRRGIVRDILKHQRVRLHLPDTGESVLVRYVDMRHIKPSSCSINAMATECYLSGVTPNYGVWSDDAVAYFKKCLTKFKGKPLYVFVEEVGNGPSVGVSLYYTTKGGDAVFLNTEMVKHDFASIRGVFMFNAKVPETPGEPTGQGRLDMLKGDASPENKDEGPIKFEIKILSYHSPSLVYVSLIDQQETFCNLYDHIRSYYNRKKIPGKEQWAVGERCCIFCRESKKWRRAVILELDNGKAKVVHTDFACVKSVPVANLKELAEEFVTIGDAAIQCHLSGIMPACGKEWPSITKEYLGELIEANPKLYMARNGAIKDKSLPVELWVEKLIPGGALDPDITKWWCFNTLIIEQGLAIPFRCQEVENTKGKNELDEMISFLKVTRSEREWRPLVTQPSVSQVTPIPNRDGKLFPINENVQEEEELLNDPGPSALSARLPAKPSSTKQSFGVPPCPTCGCSCMSAAAAETGAQGISM